MHALYFVLLFDSDSLCVGSMALIVHAAEIGGVVGSGSFILVTICFVILTMVIISVFRKRGNSQ